MRNISALIAAIICLCSCAMEDIKITSTNESDNAIFYASFEDCGVESRTYLDQNIKLLWHEDDRITLFRSTLNEQFRFTGATGDNSGGFTLVENDDWVTGNETSTNYAVYPYDASARLSNEEVILLNMPAVQNYAENSFGRGANTMVAAAESPSSKFLPFRNLGGYLIIKLYGENTIIKSIVLEGNNDEVLAGPASAEAKYGYLPVVTMSEDGAQSITLDCGDGVELGTSAESPTLFWIVVPPVTFEKGFTFTIKDINGNETTKSTSKSQTIVRNEVKSMAGFNVAFEGEGEDPVIPADDEIYYTNGSSTDPINPNRTGSFDANIVSNTYDTDKECWVIKFDNRITSIGDYAFNSCMNLTSVHIPDGVTSIGERAFFSCSALTEINIPQGINTINFGTFEKCQSLKSVVIPESVTTIGGYAFSSCNSLTDITLPDNLTDIGNYAFSSCSSLVEISLPNSLTSIGQSAFSSCSNLKEIIIPDGVRTIGNSAFSGCSKLTDVTISKAVTAIQSSTFYNCHALSKITIPDGVKTIQNNAFYSCTSLASITIPGSVTVINEHAFSGCTSLERVDITDLSAWCKIDYQTTTANPLNTGANLYLNGEEVTDLTIPSDVTELGFAKFYGCSSIKTVSIGSHVTSLSNRTFAECRNLQSVTIANGITEIGNQAFYKCKSLTTIDIPQSVKSIGNYAFEGCKSFTELTIPDNVTSIGNYSFRECSSLKILTIGSGVKSIGKDAFHLCGLEKIYCLAPTPPSLGSSNVFHNSPSVVKIYVPASEDDSVINAYKSASVWSSYAGRIYVIGTEE